MLYLKGLVNLMLGVFVRKLVIKLNYFFGIKGNSVICIIFKIGI